MNGGKVSFPRLFTAICLTVIVGITVSVSALFFIVFRSHSYKQIEGNTFERLNNLQYRIVAKFKEWTGLIQHAAVGVVPLMAQEHVDEEAIMRLFNQFMVTQTDVTLLYCSNNLVWNEPGGYAIFHNGYVPPPDWNNTQRNWFTEAKKKPGQAAYANPYIDVVTQSLCTSISFVAFDDDGRDLGVVAGDVLIDFLNELLRESAFVPGQNAYLLNQEGLFITHPDMDAVLQKDFFTEFALDRYRSSILDSPSFSIMDNEWFIYSVTIPEINWMLVSAIPRSFVFTESTNLLVKIVGVNLLLIVLSVAMSIVLTRILQNERDEITAMMDNMKVGFFLMDQRYTIQGQHSICLEQMLGSDELKGKDFISLLGTSIKAREQEDIKDYLGMVINRSYDQAMLEDINPLQEFAYIGEGGEEKTLSCGFAPVNRGNKKVYILGTIQDITMETALQRQLAQEEQKLQEEMRSLFDIVRVDPRLFNDFLEDLNYEFERIHKILQDRSQAPSEAVVDLYQSVHAIKSNALVVGLDNFSMKVHKLESKIKELREHEEITVEDMLGLAMDIEQLMLERDKFRNTIDKIRVFKVSGGTQQILIETLSQAARRAAEDMGKEIRMVVDKVDTEVLEHCPRRQVKEILLQLVRNSVCHGIEEPEERLKKGKDRVGLIRLTIQKEGDKVRIKLRDDGKGLDFDKIRERAERLHLIAREDAGGDKNWLLQAIFTPGFSTAEVEGLHGGRGIGLNLVRERIRDMGGSIKVQTEFGKGTAFIVYIPWKGAGASPIA